MSLILFSRNDPTAMSLQCPIKNCSSLRAMKPHQVKQIEDHVATSNCPHPPLKYLKIEDDGYTGTTPLILACQNGELDAVKRIVEFWGVDVCASAKYFFDLTCTTMPQQVIESATPLFVAALHGHDQIVRYLLEKGADVSAKTSNKAFLEYDGLSPLYGAVWDSPLMNQVQVPIAQLRQERSTIVRCLLEFDTDPVADSFNSSNGRLIWLNKMCGANSIIELINHGLDLKLQDPKTGGTLLHNVGALYASGFVGEDSLVVAKLLVNKGADVMARDNLGFTPILRAANLTNKRPNFAILDYLLELDGIGRMEKIDALELAGATSILSKPKCAPDLPKAFDYWRRAHHLREMEKEASGSSAEKILGPKKGGTMEWTTLSQLENIIQHPNDYKLQALLVKLRILSDRSWKAVCPILQLSETKLEDTETFVERVDILLAALNTICRFRPASELNKGLDKFAVRFVNHLIAELLSGGITSSILHLGFPYATLFSFKTFETSLDLVLLAINQLQSGHIKDIYFLNLIVLFEMIFLTPGMLSEDHNRNSTIQLLRDRVTSKRLGFILTISCGYTQNEKYLDIVRLLLEAGADPNVVIYGGPIRFHRLGLSPLHFAAKLDNQVLSDATTSLLVDFGAHVDRVNKAGQTAIDMWIDARNRNGADTGWNARPDWSRAVPKLLCLASRVLRAHKIHYKHGETPTVLHPFVAIH